ncbi:MAG: Secreted protein [Bacteroidetes bacterium 38_7]|nr:MAG: Secreted protein [Bacteroidetes bacterium 38_7]HAL65544.1 hypothetical protein [Bacteroidales bacterium]
MRKQIEFMLFFSFVLGIQAISGRAQRVYKVDYPLQAVLNVFVVTYESQAYLKIFIVDNSSKAGWGSKSKQHLLKFKK